MASQPPGATGASSTPSRRPYPLAMHQLRPTSAGISPHPAFNPSVLAALFSDEFELTAEEIETACAKMEREYSTRKETRQVLVPVRTGPGSAGSGSVPASDGVTPPSGHTSGSATPLSDIGAVLLQTSEAQRAAMAAAGEEAKKKTRRGRRGGKKTQARRAAAIAEGRPPHLPLRRQAHLQAHLQAQLAAAQAMRPARNFTLTQTALVPPEVLAIALTMRAQAANVHMTSCGILF